MKSSKPADEDHPYGHGKYEDMSGFIEGILIILAALFIIYEATQKIISGEISQHENILGIAVMFTAVILNIIVSSVLFKVAKEANSISLYADGEHLRTDIYSSLGVLLGLLLIKMTGYTILDPIMAILVAALIYKTGYSLSKQAFKRLLDYSLPKDEIEGIENIIKNFIEYAALKKNTLKARQVGPSLDIDFVLQFSGNITICECHKICDEIEKQISGIYPNSSISIQLKNILLIEQVSKRFLCHVCNGFHRHGANIGIISQTTSSLSNYFLRK